MKRFLALLCVVLYVIVVAGCTETGTHGSLRSQNEDTLPAHIETDNEQTEETLVEAGSVPNDDIGPSSADKADNQSDASEPVKTEASNAKPAETEQADAEPVDKQTGAAASAQQSAQKEKPMFEAVGSICVYSISGEKFLRSCGKSADLNDLGNDEYFSFCADITYNGAETLDIKNMYVVVDEGTPWNWSACVLDPGVCMRLHIFYSNMSGCQTQGSHYVTWYINDEAVLSESFFISEGAELEDSFAIPSAEQIADYTNPNNSRSPYISGWLSIPSEQRYMEYCVDFKADYLPSGTYCCLGNWRMDYSSLLDDYVSIRTEYDGVQGYAGFQHTAKGEMVSIMSFWDIFCTDAAGKETVIRAKLVYPQVTDGNDSFTGEGTGAHCLVPYDWQAGHWYRMHLRCRVSEETGNTVVEQWVCDLDTGVWTLLCAYDVGVKDACFIGSTAIFLENYIPAVAGEVRSLEVCNAMYQEAGTGTWRYINEAYLSSRGGAPKYEGSYKFGANGNCFWMITSGVGGDWYGNGTGQSGGYYKVTGG